MAPPSRRVRFTTGRTAADPRSSEDARVLMQSRLALLGLVTMGLSAGFLVFQLFGMIALDGVTEGLRTLAEPSRWLNLAGAVVSGALWLIARGAPRPAGALLAMDATATVLAVVPYTVMAMESPGREGVLMASLTVMLVLLCRALMIPSDAGRTFAISLVAALTSFFLALSLHLTGHVAERGHDVARLLPDLALWLVVAVAISTIASWVLFGLREEVREARRLGQYILLDKIGEGGMGAVYRAQHALLRRPTAVKLLPPDRAGETAVRRFEKEVQLTASLVHPNTITVFDFGHTPDGLFYYAMEHVDGGDLEAVVSVGGPMPPGRVAHVLAQVAGGLAEAHDIGLIHRDIKPANVLLTGAPQVADLAKIVDFGLVRELAAEESGITHTDTVLGTPLYLAPEAITSPDDVDARVDLYALGAVGYFLLTGEHVFDGRTVVEICSHHLHTRPVPPSERLGAPVPEMLEELVMSCLAKDRSLRPASASELRELLLACDDVEPWEAADARAWWAAHADAVRAFRAGESPSATAPTLAVDPSERG